MTLKQLNSNSKELKREHEKIKRQVLKDLDKLTTIELLNLWFDLRDLLRRRTDSA